MRSTGGKNDIVKHFVINVCQKLHVYFTAKAQSKEKYY